MVIIRILRKEMFYLMMHSIHFIYGYMASDMVKGHSDSERGNLMHQHELLFPINSKDSFICTISDRIAHTTVSDQFISYDVSDTNNVNTDILSTLLNKSITNLLI